MEIKIHCKYDELVSVGSLKDNPKNRNFHSETQVKHLSRLYQKHGIRHPIIVSKESGFIVAGHARKLSALLLDLETMPVVYQSFDDPIKEYEFIQSDNAIALQAEIDFKGIREDMAIFGDGLDIDGLGFEEFKILESKNEDSVEFPKLNSNDPDFQQRTFILSNEQSDILDDAIAKSKKEEDCYDEINKNSNGNALAAILKRYVHG